MSAYRQVLQHLNQLKSLGKKPRKKEQVERLYAAWNFPQKKFRSIHVAGTNGKGSVSTKIARVLSLSGYSTGLFTSPHLISYRERIDVDGQFISREEITDLFYEISSTYEKLHLQPTFFEFTTLLGFLYFSRKEVDFAVIEVGLGGKEDPTNVITPIMSVITSIGMDHMHILGSTLEAISYEKAGIIKPGVPVVLGPKACLSPICKYANSVESPCIVVHDECSFFDQENSQIALAALREIEKDFPLLPAALKEGLSLRPPCRFETFLSSDPIANHHRFFPEAVVLDVAHNPQALSSLFQAMEMYFPKRPWRVLFGISRDKDVATCARMVLAKASHIHLVSTEYSRLLSQSELEKVFFSLGREVYSRLNIAATLDRALREAVLHKEILLVCGSFYIMQETKEALVYRFFTDELAHRMENLIL